jgi:predicted ATPase
MQDDGWNVVTEALSPFDTMMMQVADPRNAPEMITLRESIRAWRFYDHFRTDADAPARSPQIGTYTPVLCDDGSDIAAAIETIRKFGDGEALSSTVDDAFPGSHLSVEENSGGFHATNETARPAQGFGGGGTIRRYPAIRPLDCCAPDATTACADGPK